MPNSPDPAEVKKQLEAMAGQTIDVTPEQLIQFVFPIGEHDTTNGIVAFRNLLGFKSCVASTLLDASGSAFTGPTGNTTFLLSNVICLPAVHSLAEPVYLLATAQSSTPFYVTTTHTLVGGGTDVQITIFAWDVKGSPASNVTVHWRLRVISNQIIGAAG
jgi:hypothetical protein